MVRLWRLSKKIKINGVEAVDIDKVVAEDSRSFEINQKDNRFWINYLYERYQDSENPSEILSYLKSLKRVNPDGLKRAAVKYLDDKNLIRFVLSPENIKELVSY